MATAISRLMSRNFRVAVWKDWKIRSTSTSVLVTQMLRFTIAFTSLVIFHELNPSLSHLFMRLILPYALLMATQASIVDLAMERHSGLRNFLRIHGLRDFLSDVGKVVVEAAQSAIVALMFSSIFMFSSVLSVKNSQLMALSIFLYLTASAAFSCFLVKFSSEPNSAAGIVVWVNVMAYLFFLAVESGGVLYYLLSMFPLTCFCQALWQITAEEFARTAPIFLSPGSLAVNTVPYWSILVTLLGQIFLYVGLASWEIRPLRAKKLQRELYSSSLNEHLLDEHTQQSLSIKNLSKSFGKFYAVKEVDFVVPKYGIFCLLGHNGAGKTTLLNLITGASQPDAGTISISKNGLWSPVQIGDFGYCPQHDIHIEGLTVYEQVELMAKLRGKPPSSVMKAINLMGLGNKTQAKFGDLSGGMKRRLTVAMADVGEPEVLILDEPTSGLDPETKGRLLQDLKDACKAKTVILTTHNMEEAEHLGDKISLMHRGQITNFNSSEDLKRRCQNCYFIQVTLDSLDQVRSILDDLSLRPEGQSELSPSGEKLVGNQKRRMMRIPLASSASPQQLREFFARIESEIEPGKVVFDSLSLQEAFVSLYSQKEQGENPMHHEEVTREAYFEEVIRVANEVIDKQKVQEEGRVWRQFWTVIWLRVIEILRRPKNILTFFLVPSIAVVDVSLRELPSGIPSIGHDAALYYTSIVWVIVTSLIVTHSVYTATVHNTDRLRYWLRVNGVKMNTYWIAMITFDTVTYIMKLGLVLCGIYVLNPHDEDKVNAIYAIAPYQILSALPTITLMLLIFRNFRYKNIVQKVVFMFIYFGAYLSVYLVHLLISYLDMNSFNVWVCAAGLIDPLWTGFYAPLRDTQFMIFAIKPNIFLDSFWSVALIQTTLGVVCCFLLLRAEKLRLLGNRRNEIANLVTTSDHVIGAFNCSKRYGSKTVVNHLNLPIPENHIQGFTGPNGAGKSTSFNLLTVEVPKDGGNVNAWKSDMDSEFFLHVGVCPQETTVWSDLTLEDHIRLVAKIKGFHLTNDDVKKLLVAFGIEKSSDVKAGALSGGNKRKLLILTSLMGNSKAKLLDEPTSGVDPVSRQVTWKMILSRKDNSGTLLSTHSMEEAETLCDKVAIMSSGVKIEDDTPLNLREKFESSYEMFVSLESYEDAQNIRTILRQEFPSCKETSDPTNATVVFTIYRDRYFLMSKLFAVVAQFRARDWGLKQASFQNVFMSLMDRHHSHTKIPLS